MFSFTSSKRLKPSRSLSRMSGSASQASATALMSHPSVDPKEAEDIARGWAKQETRSTGHEAKAKIYGDMTCALTNRQELILASAGHRTVLGRGKRFARHCFQGRCRNCDMLVKYMPGIYLQLQKPSLLYTVVPYIPSDIYICFLKEREILYIYI